MKVTRQLIDSNLVGVKYFETMQDILDDQQAHPNKYTEGTYRAYGGDPAWTPADIEYSTSAVWTLIVYSGQDQVWSPVVPDSDYSLIVTDEGLKAVAAALIGGYKLEFTKIELYSDNLRSEVDVKLLNTWTNDDVYNAQLNKVFEINKDDESYWKTHVSFNASNTTGGLQTCVKVLPTDLSLDAQSTFYIQTIMMYVQNQLNNGETDPILFGIVALPSSIYKTVDVQGFGNELTIYINTVLDNLGSVLSLEQISFDNYSLPVVMTELELPSNLNNVSQYNAYIVQNLHGSNKAALAIREPIATDWSYITANENSIKVPVGAFDSDVANYMFVKYDTENNLYIKADGSDESALGVRVGQTIVFTGSVTNYQIENVYSYNLLCTNPGTGYAEGDVLRMRDYPFDILVTKVNSVTHGIEQYSFSPLTGTEDYPDLVKGVDYTSYAKPGSAGQGATFKCVSRSLLHYDWSVDGHPLSDYVNVPLYVGMGTNAGKLTVERTSAFVGYAVSGNTIQLGLDARGHATPDVYGTVKFASQSDINSGAVLDYKVLSPYQLRNNFVIGTDDCYVGDSKNSVSNRQEVTSHLTFTHSIECTGTDLNGVAFKGTAYRALWGDLAEYYHSDKYYQAGTLIIFGAGAAEITVASTECDGVISEKPGFILGEQKSELDLPVALAGRVPVLFDGQCSVHCGDKIYLSRIMPGRASTIVNGKCIGRVIDSAPEGKEKIMCVVKINF
jgi:hypothetical protein